MRVFVWLLIAARAAASASVVTTELFWSQGLCTFNQGIDFPGTDLPGSLPQAATAAECAFSCLNRSDCYAYTHIAEQGCYLKGVASLGSGVRRLPAFTSGGCTRTEVTIPFGATIPADPAVHPGVRINNCASITCGGLCRRNCGWNQEIYQGLPDFAGATGCIEGGTTTAPEHYEMGSCAAPSTTTATTTTSLDPDYACMSIGKQRARCRSSQG